MPNLMKMTFETQFNTGLIVKNNALTLKLGKCIFADDNFYRVEVDRTVAVVTRFPRPSASKAYGVPDKRWTLAAPFEVRVWDDNGDFLLYRS